MIRAALLAALDGPVREGCAATYSRRDAPETLAAGARFVEVFAEVCGG